MSTLDRITELQQQGMKDADISRQLLNEGISSREINDSLNQAKIKNAVSQPQQDSPQMQQQSGMQQSIMQPSQEMQQPMQYPPQEQSSQIQQQYPSQAPPPQETQQYQEYYPEANQAYDQYGGQGYAPQQTLDTDTISEIAEQVVQDKFSEFEKKTGDLVSFKNEIKDKVADLNDRLKRIENSIDRLQQAIIGKIGEFGDNMASINKDLNTLHDTTSKLMNPLIDNYKELKRIAGRK